MPAPSTCSCSINFVQPGSDLRLNYSQNLLIDTHRKDPDIWPASPRWIRGLCLSAHGDKPKTTWDPTPDTYRQASALGQPYWIPYRLLAAVQSAASSTCHGASTGGRPGRRCSSATTQEVFQVFLVQGLRYHRQDKTTTNNLHHGRRGRTPAHSLRMGSLETQGINMVPRYRHDWISCLLNGALPAAAGRHLYPSWRAAW